MQTTRRRFHVRHPAQPSHSHGEFVFSAKPTSALGRAQQSRHIVTCQIELRDKIKPSASANRRFLS